MNTRVRNTKLRYSFLFIGILISFLFGCSESSINWLTEDQRYLTPIPEATLAAYHSDMPITNRLEAVIAAQMFVKTTRQEYEETPGVVSVDELTLDEAHQKVRDPQPGNSYSENRPGNTKAWLVMLEGNYRILPPVSDYTPEPFSHGCVYVIVDKDGGGEMTTIDCP